MDGGRVVIFLSLIYLIVLFLLSMGRAVAMEFSL